MNVEDVANVVVLGYTTWKWYHEWKDRKKKERSQANKHSKQKAGKRSK